MADKIQNLSQFTDEQLEQLARTPFVQPPPGVTPNFVNPPTRATLQIWTTSIFLGIATMSYANRIYVKTRLMKTWSWDDVTLFLTVILAIAQYGVMTEGVLGGFMGRHSWDVSLAQMLGSWLPPVAYAILVLTPWTLLFMKTTFFLLYLHLFGRIRWIRITSWVSICFVVASNSAVGIYAFIIANPYENASWGGKGTQLGIPIGILSIVADVIIFIIPFAAILPLQISPVKRLGALLIFLTGGSAIICSVLNIYYRYQILHSTDRMWDSVLGTITALSEVLLGITCACLPSAAYGFRHENSVYNRLLRPSLYHTSRQQPSSYAPNFRHCSKAADTGSVNSRSRIRCTTHVEIPPLDPMSDYEGRKERSSFDQIFEEVQGGSGMELRSLEPVHLPASAGSHETA